MHVSNKTSPSLGLDTEKGDLRALWVRRETVPLLWATVGGPSKAKRVWNATCGCLHERKGTLILRGIHAPVFFTASLTTAT